MGVEGRTTALSPEDLAALDAGLRGTVLLPGAPGYEDSRTIWNAMIDRHPALVARCVGCADYLGNPNVEWHVRGFGCGQAALSSDVDEDRRARHSEPLRGLSPTT